MTTEPLYYTFSKESFLLNNINNHNSNFHVIVVLIDDNMIADDIWLNYLKKVLYHEFSEYSKSFVIPVLYTENGFDYIGKFHSINLFYIKEYILQLDELFFCLNEELIKYMKRELNQKEQTKIFISHAKKDGNIIGKKIRDYIASHSHSQTFYDENNIMYGENFETTIFNNIDDCMFLVIQTDLYSEREWCIKEILDAKKKKVPIVVVNALTSGEYRSFPYLGNVPTIKWRDDDFTIRKIITLLMYETLKNIYFNTFLYNLSMLYKYTKNIKYISRYPELLDLIDTKDDQIILYPDPPIGYDELTVLNSFSASISLLTPITLPAKSLKIDSQKVLNIGISISNDVNEQRYEIGIEHLDNIFIELIRHLLIFGHKIVYGGDWRKEGFTETIANILKIYKNKGILNEIFFSNYLAWPIYHKMDISLIAKLKSVVNIIKVNLPDEIAILHQIDTSKYLERKTLQDQYIWAKSLSNMRRIMDANTDVRIVLGGRTEHSIGKINGILEEVYIAMQNNTPLYLIGGFGGMTEEIINILLGKTSVVFERLINENDDFVNFYNMQEKAIKGETIDYSKIKEYIFKQGVDGLNNNLTFEENQILFSSRNTNEIIALILKGIISLR